MGLIFQLPLQLVLQGVEALNLMDGGFSISQRKDGVNFNILIPLSAQSSFIL